MKDLISRKKAYEVLTEYYHHKHISQHIALREALDRVPGEESERTKKGKWIVTRPNVTVYVYHCSVCGAYHRALYDYCPTCGSDMKGELNNE